MSATKHKCPRRIAPLRIQREARRAGAALDYSRLLSARPIESAPTTRVDWKSFPFTSRPIKYAGMISDAQKKLLQQRILLIHENQTRFPRNPSAPIPREWRIRHNGVLFVTSGGICACLKNLMPLHTIILDFPKNSWIECLIGQKRRYVAFFLRLDCHLTILL